MLIWSWPVIWYDINLSSVSSEQWNISNVLTDLGTQAVFCWMFLLFLFKSPPRHRKVWDSHWLIIISTHISMSVNLPVFFRSSFISSQSITKDSHTTRQKSKHRREVETLTKKIQELKHLRPPPSLPSLSSNELNVWLKLVGHIAGLTELFIVVFLRNNLNNWSSLYIFCSIWK